jgi:predicted CoA-binding protein
MASPGYSGKPVHAKLGIKPGMSVSVVNAPADYEDLLEDPPKDVRYVRSVTESVDIVHVFSTSRRELQELLTKLVSRIRKDGVVWVSWPKKSAQVATDITEDAIREVAFPLGLVDVKVCAVSEVWSGLKLVIRRQNR